MLADLLFTLEAFREQDIQSERSNEDEWLRFSLSKMSADQSEVATSNIPPFATRSTVTLSGNLLTF